MRHVNRLSNERYECTSCERAYQFDDVCETWKCPHCGDLITIYAEDMQSETRITLHRKKASEVEVGDLVHVEGGLLQDPRSVLGTQQVAGNKIQLGLQGDRGRRFEPDDPINVRIGGAWK